MPHLGMLHRLNMMTGLPYRRHRLPFPGLSPTKGRELGKVPIEEGWRWQGLWCHVADCRCCSFQAAPKSREQSVALGG